MLHDEAFVSKDSRIEIEHQPAANLIQTGFLLVVCAICPASA